MNNDHSFHALGLNPRSIPGLAVLVILACGCASSSSDSVAPKPGHGIAEYRAVVTEAQRSVKAVVDSLEELQKTSPPPLTRPDFTRFDKAFHNLEVTSVRTRARADAIIARGETYFEEWKENLSGMTNSAVAQAESERYLRMREHFDRVRQRSGDVRTEFRPFMTKLREARARFDRPTVATDETGKAIETFIGGGKRVLETLEAVLTALNEAESALRATPAATAETK